MRLVLRALWWLLVALFAYLAAWPVDIQPLAWDPPDAQGLVGAFSSNGKLSKRALRAPELHGPEALAADARGRIFTGTARGEIARLGPAGKTKVFANTGGRPLGLVALKDERLIVADARKGLLQVDLQGHVAVLVDRFQGDPLGALDGLDATPDGEILITAATRPHANGDADLEALEHRPTGRLFAYDPASRRLSLVLDGLITPRGVAVAGDGSSALVTEGCAYRLRRIFLTGPRRGQHEVLIDNLPGPPGNVSYDPQRGLFWVALSAPREPWLDLLGPYPALRRVVARLPRSVRPDSARHALVMAIRPNGTLAGFFDDAGAAAYAPISSVLALKDRLYLGSAERDGVAHLPIPALAAAP